MSNYMKVNFCKFRGKCSFRHETHGYPICTWDGTCNQQTDTPPETDIEIYQLQLGSFSRKPKVKPQEVLIG